jgi:hypothetical protein
MGNICCTTPAKEVSQRRHFKIPSEFDDLFDKYGYIKKGCDPKLIKKYYEYTLYRKFYDYDKIK